MPRNNVEPLPCRDCRFNFDGKCYRNPPNIVQYQENSVTKFVTCPPQAVGACCAGEPRVDRSCLTCQKHLDCEIEYSVQKFRRVTDWHCSDWELKE